MPKTGLTTREWQRRLEDYANGRFEFGPGRGQRPPPNSTWGLKVVRIEQCPRHSGATLNVHVATMKPGVLHRHLALVGILGVLRVSNS